MPVLSSIRIWLTANDYLTFEYAAASLQYEPQGERIRDRNGIVHRISSPVQRYPSWLLLSLPSADLMRTNNSSAPLPRSALEWLDAAFRQQSELTVFVSGASLASDSSAIARQLAYVGKLDELAGAGLCSLPGRLSIAGRGSPGPASLGTDPDWLELRLHVSQDGSFSDFEQLASYTQYQPPRPGL